MGTAREDTGLTGFDLDVEESLRGGSTPPPGPPPSKEEGRGEVLPPQRPGLNTIARRTAERLQREKGVPFNITYDRLVGAEGWRGREQEWLASQTGTSKEQLSQIRKEGEEGATPQERKAASDAYTRAVLVKKQREQVAREAAAKEQAIAQEATREAKRQAEVARQALSTRTVIDQASKQAAQGDWAAFIKKNTQLPDGKWISKADLKQVEKESPEVFTLLVNKGFTAAEAEIEKVNKNITNAEAKLARQQAGSAKLSKLAEEYMPQLGQAQSKIAPIALAIWQTLTPWNESANQTITSYLKEFSKPTQLSQVELKAQFDSFAQLPAWAKILSFPGVIKGNDGKYYRLLSGEAPLVGGSKKEAIEAGAKVAQKIATKTITREEAAKELADRAKALATKIVDNIKAGKEGKPFTKEQSNIVEKILSNLKQSKNADELAKNIKAGEKAIVSITGKPSPLSEASFSKQVIKAMQLGKQTPEEIAAHISKLTSKEASDILKYIPGKAQAVRAILEQTTRKATMAAIILNPSEAISSLSRLSTAQRTKAINQIDTELKELTQTKTLTQVQFKELTALKNQTMAALELSVATELSNQLKRQEKTATEIQEAVATQLKNELKNITDTDTKTRLQEQLGTLLITPTAPTPTRTPQAITPPTRTPPTRTPPIKTPPTRTPPIKTPPTRTPPTRTPPSKIPPIKLPSGDKREASWSSAQIKSAIAWKDGFIIHAIKYPYRRGVDERSFHVNNAPRGLDVLDIKGPGSQQASARVIKGKLKGPRTVDIGNQDLVIVPTKGNRVKMYFNRDNRGTVSQLTIKRRSISKKKGRVYHTDMGGSTIISRRALRGY